MTDVTLIELLDFLAELSVNGETFEIANSALNLQTKLLKYYGPQY